MTLPEMLAEIRDLRARVMDLQVSANDLADKVIDLQRAEGHALDISGVAAELGISRRTAYRWWEDGKIPEPDVRYGGINRWWPESVRGLHISTEIKKRVA